MRMMIPERLLPVLHRSSFDAWEVLPARDTGDRDLAQLVAEGYRTQAELLVVPCEGLIQRAEKEGVSVILEGVHVNPETFAALSKDREAIVVNVLLAVLKSKELKSRLQGRSSKEPRRTVEHYLEYFDSIWQLQSYLLSEADRCDVPIISNDDREKAKGEIIRAIHQVLARHFSGGPEEVFGPVAAADCDNDWRQFLNRLAA
jgi:2-phosphoglycerate kinase